MTAPEYLTLTAPKAKRKKRAAATKHPEDKVHIAVLNWIRKVAPDCIVFHPANGGFRILKEALRFKQIGVMAGIPDLIVIPPDGITTGIEIKPEKGGTHTPKQKMVGRKFIRNNARYAVVRSIDEVRKCFSEWNIATKESRQ